MTPLRSESLDDVIIAVEDADPLLLVTVPPPLDPVFKLPPVELLLEVLVELPPVTLDVVPEYS
jgi:hypothetical protein